MSHIIKISIIQCVKMFLYIKSDVFNIGLRLAYQTSLIRSFIDFFSQTLKQVFHFTDNLACLYKDELSHLLDYELLS